MILSIKFPLFPESSMEEWWGVEGVLGYLGSLRGGVS